jgi:hypothetical protein
MRCRTIHDDIAESIAATGPATVDEVYDYLFDSGRHRYDMPTKRELQGIIRQVPGIHRTTPYGERPARYDIAGVQA